MKKRLVSMAVGAALAGGAVTAHAVNVNPDGHGQALIYPFYTVEGGYDTYISITNVTNQTKAVKVRFLEAMNSQEVLDFNLYLSPFDMWTAVVTSDQASGPAILRTSDTSCTVPAIPSAGVAFRNFEYDVSPERERGLDRTREGYLEIIEMGVVTGVKAAAAKHTSDGVPFNCGTLNAAWNTGGVWLQNPFDEMLPPTGGLYGYGVLINVENGTNATYDAIALDDFSATILHTNPGDVTPTLASANPAVTRVFDQGQLVEASFLSGADAVSAALMYDSIFNDYALDQDIAAGTDWVINFPTKRFYTNPPGQPARPPFTQEWVRSTSSACEEISISYWDREEQNIIADDLDFSPRPPGDPALSLCYEANVLTFNESEVLAPSNRVRRNLEVEFENGWAAISFTNPNNALTSLEGYTFEGLPVVGFAVQQYVNGVLPNGVLSNYQGLMNHKALRIVTSS